MTVGGLAASCRMCGAAFYRSVIARGADGGLRETGLYQCAGCSVVFTDPEAWRDSSAGQSSAAEAPTPAPIPPSHRGPPTAPRAPEPPDLTTYGSSPAGKPSARR